MGSVITLYHNPRCRKSREALQLIQDQGAAMEIKEYLKEPPTAEELKAVLGKLGMHPLELIRQGEKIFKEQFRSKDLSDEEWIQAMVGNPILIERPIAIKGGKAVVGRPPERVEELL